MDDFDGAAFNYAIAREAFYKAQVRVAEAKADLTRTKSQLDDLEAEVIANGGDGAAVIDGKNAETRAAQLRLILSGNARHRDLQERAQDLEAEIALQGVAADHEANLMSLARRVMDWDIARTQREAATEAGLGVERKYSHG